MKLCMFTPAAEQLERGWPGRVDGGHVIQLAAQTLQSYFASGSNAREHAGFRLEDVLLRAPVLEPPSIRAFEDASTFRFCNPAAVRSPGAQIARPRVSEARGGRLDAAARWVAIVGGEGELAGWTGMVEWLAPGLPRPKDCDFALLLGPLVDTDRRVGFDWEAARDVAAENTRLRPGDLLAGPPLARYDDLPSGRFAHVFDGLGELTATVA
jgi:hypothetical protein